MIRTLRDLEEEYINSNLAEYLKNCSKDELKIFERFILCDDIIGIRIQIYEIIKKELKKFANDQTLNNNVNLEEINNNEIKKSY